VKRVILVTAAFPYFATEQFLETEIEYYKEFQELSLTLLPLSKTKDLRKIDATITLDQTFADVKVPSSLQKLTFLAKSLLNKVFYQELFSINSWNLSVLKTFLATMALYQRYYELFDEYFSKQTRLDQTLLYTYWHDEANYALGSLKDKYGYKLVSRIHGYDLYAQRRVANYMPLKRVFSQKIDKIFTITQTANSYLHKQYGFDNALLELSRLGVNDPCIVTKPSKQNCLHVVSCSFLVEVKRVEKIIEALASLAQTQTELRIQWSHIGDGTLFNTLSVKAKELLSEKDNVKYNFLGNLANEAVYQFYKNNEIDLFINVSASEGVPVTIMEAMSCHIPIIAPDIGGVADMVIDGYNGILLPQECEIDGIVHALSQIELFKSQEIREHAYKIFLEKYDAKRNYKEFIEQLLTI
jgi:colanic acid/amylovoran biosynthesis glycosyltransferase